MMDELQMFADYATVSDPEALAALNDIFSVLCEIRDIEQAILSWIAWVVIIGVAAVVAYFVFKPVFYFFNR